MKNDPTSQIVISALQSLGWQVSDGAAIAVKTFETAVGPKQAIAYLSPARPGAYHRSLFGDYQSEGRNILAPHGELIAIDAGPADAERIARRFAAEVDAVVADSYAVRLLR
ncbi:MAG: hypothetical protein E6R08_10240 [Nevskiaceae bacterium]|nr:MAG: hypothetical protein E6R08_10240 [Nevskiaceae bacterium]